MGREKVTGAGVLPLFQFLAAWVGMWAARHQANQIAYLKAVTSALLERLGKKRLRFTDTLRDFDFGRSIRFAFDSINDRLAPRYGRRTGFEEVSR